MRTRLSYKRFKKWALKNGWLLIFKRGPYEFRDTKDRMSEHWLSSTGQEVIVKINGNFVMGIETVVVYYGPSEVDFPGDYPKIIQKGK